MEFNKKDDNKTLPIFNALLFGFRWALDKFSLFFKVLVIYALVLSGCLLLANLDWSYPWLATVIALYIILDVGMYLGFIKMCFELHDSGVSSIATLFSCFHRVFQGLLLVVLYVLGVVIGLLFFIVPGVVFAMRGLFAPYCFVDKNMGIFESFAESFRITRGYTVSLLPLLIFAILVPTDFLSPFISVLVRALLLKASMLSSASVLGVLNSNSAVFFVFVLFSPVIYLATVYLYRFMSAQADNEEREILFMDIVKDTF